MAFAGLVSSWAAEVHAQDAPSAAQRVHSDRGYPTRVRIRPPSGAAYGGGDIVFGGAGGGERATSAESGEGRPTGSDRRRLGDARDRGDAPQASDRSQQPSAGPGMVSATANALGYVILIIVGVALLAFIVWMVSKLRLPAREITPEESADNAEDGAEIVGPAIRIVEGDPDHLAAEGRFDEAIAALLVRALKTTGWVPEGKGQSLTAREVLSTVGLHDERRAPLGVIVNVAERVRFAGVAANADHYQEARGQWPRLTAGAAR